MRALALYILLSSFGASLYAQDQPLSEYQQLAVEHNPAMKAAYTEFEAAMERVSQEGALPNPTLSFGYFISPVETRVGPQRARLSLSQMFLWFGTLKANEAVATLEAEARYARFIDEREKLIRQVSEQYYMIWQTEKIIELERENLRILRAYEGLAENRFGSNEGRLASVFNVQLDIAKAETQLKLLERKRQVLKDNFMVVLNYSLDSSNIVISDTVFTTTVQDESFYQDLSDHPTAHFYDIKRNAATARGEVAQRNKYPSFGAGLDYVMVGKRDDMMVDDNGKDVLMPMVSLGLPIWRKKYASQQREASLIERQYEFEQENSINKIKSQLDIALYEYWAAKEEFELYKSQLTLAEKTLDLTISDYSNDLERFEEVLKVQQQLLIYKRKYYEAYTRQLIKTAEIKYLTYHMPAGAMRNSGIEGN